MSLLKNKIKKYWFYIVIFFFSAFRMFLAVNTNYAVTSGRFDDELAIHQGYSLLLGEWLGDYSYSTLIKGITYPCYVALIKLLGLTYGQGLGILMIAASLIFLRMLYKFNKSKVFLVVAYAFILYNPGGFGGWTALHIYRDVMTMWLLLILFSCVIAIYANRKLAWQESYGWITGAVISFVLFYYLREDCIWLYPFVFVAFLICAFSHYFGPAKKLGKRYGTKLIRIVVFTFLPWIGVGIAGVGIATANYHNYGIFCVNDRTQGTFADMMELIYCVEDDSTDEHIWVTKDMLWKCIDASPTLSGMQDAIEAGYNSRALDDGQVHGDIIQWAMRVGFHNAGYYTDAKETQIMLSKVVEELQTAYDRGILIEDSKIHLSAQGRGMTFSEICGYIPDAFFNFFELSEYEGCSSYYPYYPTTEEELTSKFEYMLSTPLSKNYIDSELYIFTENVFEIIRKIYQRLGDPALKYSCVFFGILSIWEVVQCKKHKKVSKEFEILLPLVGLMMSGFLLIYVITVFTSFLTIYNFYNYTTGYYTIVSIFEVFVANHILSLPIWKTGASKINGKA